jgi:hypothetical protein
LVTALIFGQAVLFASWGVALYGIVIVAAFQTFVRLYEEPTLREAFGEENAAYCAATPRWTPGSGAKPPADEDLAHLAVVEPPAVPNGPPPQEDPIE